MDNQKSPTPNDVSNPKNPVVSVILPVFNGERYLSEAIESIINQTFRDFEFIVINDGSTDSTSSIIQKWLPLDSRIKLIERENRGLIHSLNEGIELAQGKYIARMDSDDISDPERLQKQVNYLENNQDTHLLGVRVYTSHFLKRRFVGVIGKKESTWSLLFSNKIGHPGVMIRAATLKANNLRYEKNYLFAEDFKLWSQITRFGYADILPDRLLYYRIHNESVSRKNFLAQHSIERKILIENIKDRLAIDMSDCEDYFPASWAKALSNRIFCSTNYKTLSRADRIAIHRAFQDYAAIFGTHVALAYFKNAGLDAIRSGRFMLLSYIWRTIKHQCIKNSEGYYLKRNLRSFEHL